ncbi:MAG: hypothetical protein IT473_10265 [Lysobacter sp.]|nr:hypothetical protein [Lysobacter sp.]
MANDQATANDGMTASTTVPTGQPQTGTGTPANINAAPPASPSTANPAAGAATTAAPIEIDGAAVVPAAKIGAEVTMPDGKKVTSSELFSADGVTITRESVAKGISPVDGNPTSEADQFQNKLVITTGNDNDQVNISQRTDGTLDVEVNGKKFHVALGPNQELGVVTKDGNDVIHAADNVTVNMDVNGGAGNDSITTGQGNDRIDAGAGDDMVRSGAGRDDVFGNTGNDTIDAGDGHDVVYGGDGDDVLQGGRGRDYLEGGKGNDNLLGGSGNDILSGGLGDDALLGQEGDDRVYTGAGKDTVSNNAGSDTVYGQAADDTVAAGKGATNTVTETPSTATPGSSIVVTGSPEFQQRVQADLEMLRSSPEGRALLTQIDAAAAAPGGHNVTLRELTYEHNGFAYGDNSTNDEFLTKDASGNLIAGKGEKAVVEYNPSDHDDRFTAPTVTLFHELSHAYNIVTGTMQDGENTLSGDDSGTPLAEMQAAGLPNDGANYNFPGGSGPSNVNPFNENTFRQEMGLPQRPSYSFSSPWDGGLGSPVAMAPVGGGSTPFASTGDAALDRMLAAMQNSDSQGLRQASASLYDQNAGQFKEQGAADLARQQAEVKPQQIVPPQADQPEQAAWGQRR